MLQETIRALSFTDTDIAVRHRGLGQVYKDLIVTNNHLTYLSRDIYDDGYKIFVHKKVDRGLAMA